MTFTDKIEAHIFGDGGETPPLAITDKHVTALSRAIEAEGYRIMVDAETGDVKLEKRDDDHSL